MKLHTLLPVLLIVFGGCTNHKDHMTDLDSRVGMVGEYGVELLRSLVVDPVATDITNIPSYMDTKLEAINNVR